MRAPDARRRLVVVRDAHRHRWMRELTEALSPAVVVEIGVPLWQPDGPAYIATHGGSRVSFEAVAEVGARDVALELELREQPDALARLLDAQAAQAKRLGALFRRRDVRYLLIASRGSSANAARYAQYLLGRASRVPVAFATPSLYTLYHQPPRFDGALVIGISQSGESPDVLAGDRGGAPPGPADDRDHEPPGSPLGPAAEEVLPLEAGDEQAVAATKTYVNSLGAIALLFGWSTRDAEALAELGADAGARSPRRSSGRSTTSPRSASRRRPRRHRRRPRDQLRHRVRDRAQDPRALRAPVRGLVVGRPDARAGRGDHAGLAGDRRRAARARAREHGDGDRGPCRARRAPVS